MPGFVPVKNPSFVGREYYMDDEAVEDQLNGFHSTTRRASELFDGNDGLACCDWLYQSSPSPEDILLTAEEEREEGESILRKEGLRVAA